MEPTITPEIIVAYSQCPRKAYLLLFSPDKGEPHEYVQILEQQRCANQERHLNRLQQTHADVQPYSLENLRKGSKVLIHAHLQVDGFAADCGVLTRVEGTSTFGKYSYEPSICVGTHSISKEQKLEMSFVGSVLECLQSTSPAAGRIIGMDGTSHTVKLDHHAKDLRPLLEPLHEWTTVDSPTPPPLVLNKHCPLCPFQRLCQTQAEQEDNLSLLNGMTARVMRQYEKKGIFTVKQLSYLFKPRKPKKRSRKPPPVTHKIELQALAIREHKIYLQELPELSRQPVELFVDMEGVPDRGLYYLFGVLVCQGATTEHYSFWADTDQDEHHIWQQFVDTVTQYPDAPIYHYGSYELRAITTLAKRYQTDAPSVIKRLVNVNGYIYGKVYFPVRSNRLKELGAFIGAKWTSPDASGLQSLVWRHHWEQTQDATYREVLVVYNREDCHALRLLTDEISMIKHSSDTLSEIDFADKRKQNFSEKGQQIHSQFKEILKFAHFGYDDKKISFRRDSNEESKQNKLEVQRRQYNHLNRIRADVRRRAKKIVAISPDERCPKCYYKPFTQTTLISRRYIIDLVLTKNGLKKTITQYAGTQGHCPKCQRNYAPEQIRQYPRNSVYGHGFGAWVIYQRVALRLPYASIIESLSEQFSEKISTARLIDFLKQYAHYYAETEKSITRSLLRSRYIHVDETKVNIKGSNWYVWVFTDEKHVIFTLKETREADFVHELLRNYPGVLISDFYPGYDSVECRQQKCWVHLIRDLNDDLQENPFDKEFEAFIFEVRNFIVPIMETIQKYGLKRRYLDKFEQKIDPFYCRVIVDKQYKSDLVLKYQKRFLRYKESLFTFMKEDGIPWHNNTAERAIRPFAIQRDTSKSPLYDSATRHYLTLLSIRQTCRFQGKSFFKFLFSGATDLDMFETRKRKRSQVIPQ
jgi:predicted RecB family nuclease